MSRLALVGAVVAALLVVVALAVAVGSRVLEQGAPAPAPVAPPAPPPAPSSRPVPETVLASTMAHPAAATAQGFLYGRITAVDGTTYEGRLRFGGREEAFWGDYFNGTKEENLWVDQVPADRLPTERHPVEILGIKLAETETTLDVARLFMARFGDLSRIEARGRDVRVTLKSGTTFDLNRFDASDFDDGVRVWDPRRGVVDLDSLKVRTIDLLPTPALEATPYRLYGTVTTRAGAFTGFIQWDRVDCVGTDELDGRNDDGDVHLRYDNLRSIARRPDGGATVKTLAGAEIVLHASREAGPDNRGIYVDDPRYGRVLVSWEAFGKVDFAPGESGPSYDEYAKGGSLTGTVTTRTGGRLSGRLVYDLDESETVETLDAPVAGVDYTIPFGMIASIVPPGSDAPNTPTARVLLRNGEELQLERRGDLGDKNAGILIFVEGRERPEYVLWSEVGRVDFDGAPRAGG